MFVGKEAITWNLDIVHHHKLYFMLDSKSIHIKYIASGGNTEFELVPVLWKQKNS